MQMIELKEHNVLPYENLVENLYTHKRVAYISATGTGKSYVVGKYVEDMYDTKEVLIIVPSVTIKDNWINLLGEGCTVKTYQGIALFWLSEDISKYSLIILDEFHHTGAEKWGYAIASIIDDFDGEIIGLSATPIRYLDNCRNMVDELFDGNQVLGYDLDKAATYGIIPKLHYIPARYKSTNVNEVYGTDEEKKLIHKLDLFRSENSIENILKKHKLHEHKRVLVFSSTIEGIKESIDILSSIYPDAKHYTLLCSTTDNARKQIMEEFENATTLSFLHSINVLSEGVHIPNVHAEIMFRKTVSPNIYTQQLGRVINTDNMGGIVDIFDFVSNISNMQSYDGLFSQSVDQAQVSYCNSESTGSFRKQMIVDDYVMEESEILDALMRLQSSEWFPYEIQILKDHYKDGYNELAKLIPRHTREAIKGKCKIIGITDGKKVIATNDVVEDIKEYYPDYGSAKIAELHPDLSRASICSLAKRLGIKRNAKDYRNNDDLKAILENMLKIPKYKYARTDIILNYPDMPDGVSKHEVLMILNNIRGEYRSVVVKERNDYILKVYNEKGFNALLKDPYVGHFSNTFLRKVTGSGACKIKRFDSDAVQDIQKFIDEGQHQRKETLDFLRSKANEYNEDYDRVLNLYKRLYRESNGYIDNAINNRYTEEEKNIINNYINGKLDVSTIDDLVSKYIPGRTVLGIKSYIKKHRRELTA